MAFEWYERWQDRRRLKKAYKILTQMLEVHLENGGKIDELFLPMTDSPIAWNQKGQFWYVDAADAGAVKIGSGIILNNGRGGATEEATVVERLDAGVGAGGGGVYRVEFDRGSRDLGEVLRIVLPGDGMDGLK